jgi:hypothetical protein
MQKLYKKYCSERGFRQSVRLFVFLFVYALLSVPTFAAVFNVTNTTDGPATTQLRGAIAAADAAGGTHTINVAAGNYILTLGTISFGNTAQNISIIGAGAATTTITMTSNVAQRDRIFVINPPGTTPNVFTTFSNIKLANGYLTSDTFGGAAIYAGPINGLSQSLTINNCIFDNNVTPAGGGLGGAIYMYQETLNITNSTFSNNRSTDGVGGAIYYFLQNNTGNSGLVNITNSTFTGNTTGGNGGAINFAAQGGLPMGATFSVNISRNTFLNNSATGSGIGGAIFANNSANVSTPTINFNRFVGNTSAGSAASSGLHFAESAGSVNAANNWWGCNTGPTASPCDRAGGDIAGGGSLTTSPWLQLRNVPSKNTVVVGETLTLTSDILGLSTGGSTAAGNLIGLSAFPLTSSTIFTNPVRGTLSATTGQFVNGIANLTPTFTATTVGAGSADATGDSQTITTSTITINKANTTATIGTDTPDPSNVGQNVTVTYSVAVTAPGGGTPGGNVVVADGATTICTGTVAAGQCTGQMNTAGNRSLTATYQGDSNYNASAASSSVSHVVGQVTWTGGSDTNFTNNSNWNTGLAPGSGDTAIIPTGATNQPGISTSNISVSALSVALGRTLTIIAPRTLTVSGTLTNNGTINGTGTIINNFNNAGTLAPGLSPGIMNITGTFANPGILAMEIGGTGGAGVNPNGHDQLLVSGAATLGGTLNLTLTNGFTPSPGNSFLILDAASSIGAFNTVNLPNIFPNTWNVAYNNTAGTVTLTVVAPTAANTSVSGRVFDTNGRGVSGAHVTITDSNGNIIYALTNPFGYYRFSDVAAGQTYVIGVTSKRHRFTPRVISVSDDLTDVNFVPNQ